MRLKRWIRLLILVALAGYFGAALVMDRRAEPPVPQWTENDPRGHALASMIIDLVKGQLESMGGWLPNDPPATPGRFLDNTPAFQLGMLRVVRIAGGALRDYFSREGGPVHKDLDLAYSKLSNDPRRWAFPSAEGALGDALEALERYRADLGGQSVFIGSPDRLQRLLESLAGELEQTSAYLGGSSTAGRAGWWDCDDRFYLALGQAQGLLGLLGAAGLEHQVILSENGLAEDYQALLKSLEQSLFEPWIVTNGDKDGILANHSNNLKVSLDETLHRMKGLAARLGAPGP